MTRKNDIMRAAKDTIRVGGVSMAGGAVMGGMAGMHGMPTGAGHVAGLATSGLALVNVGQLAKTGLTVTRTIAPAPPTRRQRVRQKVRQRSGTGSIVEKILGR